VPGAPVAPVPWLAPWFDGWRDTGAAVQARWSAGQSLHQALNDAAGALPIHFTAHDALPPGAAYEAHVAATGQCPTRDNLHDFFNGLCWLRFPRTKRRINQLQAQAIARDGIRPTRGPLRDALTLFDENGALFLGPPVLLQALQARDWHGLFVSQRPLWTQARVVLFGHALLEKLAGTPRKDITAHVLVPRGLPPGADAGCAALDAWLADELGAHRLAAKPFTPLPVLGVPGWWAENQNFSFYDDSLVFRPRRTPEQPQQSLCGTRGT